MNLHHRKVTGFTIAELIISVAVISILMAFVMPAVYSAFVSLEERETRRKVDILAVGIERAYVNSIATIATSERPRLVIGTEFVPASESLTSAQISPLLRFMGKDGGDEIRFDGGATPFAIYISDPLTDMYLGTTYTYRIVHIVSQGRNRVLDIKFDETTAVVLTSGDDVFRVIDGRESTRAAIAKTRERLDRVKSQFERYYQTRYLTDTGRSPAKNYFGSGATGSYPYPELWDGSSNVIGRTSNGNVRALAAALGISVADTASVFDETGFSSSSATITYDNVSPAVRSPSNTLPAMQTAPYSIAINAVTPWGEVMSSTAQSTY